MALVHAIVSINFKADQIVSGIAINLAALGLTNYLLFVQTGNQGVPSLKDSLRLPSISLGPISHIPFIGPVFFQQNIVFYIAILILIGIQFLLFRTNIGLRIRAVGEHPQAADTAGVNVRLVRYLCVISSGLLSGLAGAFLSMGIAGIFNSNMTAGRGFHCASGNDFRQVYALGYRRSLPDLWAGRGFEYAHARYRHLSQPAQYLAIHTHADRARWSDRAHHSTRRRWHPV